MLEGNRGQVTQQKLNQILAEHQKWLSNPQTGTRLVLENFDLTGLTLRGNLKLASFKNCELVAVTFDNVTLEQSEFLGTELSLSKFENTEAQGQWTIFRDCQMTRCEWKFCNILNGRFTNCQLDENVFSNTTFLAARFLQCQAESTVWNSGGLRSSSLNVCRFDNPTFAKSVIFDSSFSAGSMRNLDLSQLISATDSKFSGVDLDGFKAEGMVLGTGGLGIKSLTGSSMKNAEADNSNFKDVTLTGCDFTAARLRNAIFSGQDLDGVIFKSAEAVGIKLNDCTAFRADFSDAEIVNAEGLQLYAAGANFARTKIRGAIFEFADLTGTNFTGSDIDNTVSLGGANLSGAFWTAGQRCRAGSFGRCIL